MLMHIQAPVDFLDCSHSLEKSQLTKNMLFSGLLTVVATTLENSDTKIISSLVHCYCSGLKWHLEKRSSDFGNDN